MNIEQRLELLTAAIVDLTETIRQAHNMAADEGAASEPATNAQKVAKRAEPEAEPEQPTEPQAEQPSVTKEQLQNLCIETVRNDKTFKDKVQAELKKHGVKTISQLPDDAVASVHGNLFGGE